MYYRYRVTTQARARFSVAEYIEVFYHRKREQSTLDYQTPSDVLAHFYTVSFVALSDHLMSVELSRSWAKFIIVMVS